jgi:hypothetical protein
LEQREYISNRKKGTIPKFSNNVNYLKVLLETKNILSFVHAKNVGRSTISGHKKIYSGYVHAHANKLKIFLGTHDRNPDLSDHLDDLEASE